MPSSSKTIYEFGPFRLDLSEGVLYRSGELVPLTPKAFDTLVVFLQNAGRVLGKEEVMSQVWPDTFVEEANLAVNISLLRKSLGLRPDGGQYIETLPRRGYRFAVEVKEDGGILLESTAMTSQSHSHQQFSVKAEIGDSSTALPPLSAAAPAFRLAKPPQTQYASSGDVNIAYQVVGDAPLDLVFVMGWVSHLEYFWEEPSFARFLTRLASFSRLVLFDKRGTGLSDRVPLTELPTLEQRMDDVRAVMDAVGIERAALVGVSEGGPMCSLFAATYPEKTSALVMIGSYAKRIWAEDYPWAPTADQRHHFFEEIQRNWGGPVGLAERAPSMADDLQFQRWWATYLRMGASPGAALALTQMNAEIDIRYILPTIRVPTLVLHRTGDLCLKVEEGRYLAERIAGAKYIELPGMDHLPFVGQQDEILDEIEEFLTGMRHHGFYDRVLATVLITQVVNADSLSAETLSRFTAYIRKEVQLFRGREIAIGTAGCLATFDGPARAIRCALAINEIARRVGVVAQTGLHTGECDLLETGISGLAVEIARHVVARAIADEVLVSSTVRDLVAGSGIRFVERGQHDFGENMGELRLYAINRTP